MARSWVAPAHGTPVSLTLFSDVGNDRTMGQDSQLMTGQKGLKTSISRLARVGPIRLLGSDLGVPSKQWLETVGDVAQRCSQ